MVDTDLEQGLIVIPLTQGFFTFVDLIDADLTSLQWQYAKGYAIHSEWQHGKVIKRRLHKVILERIIGRSLAPKEMCDHKNTARLDNRRMNLRLATNQKNSFNQSRPRHNTSGFKGVVFLRGKWQAQLKHDGKNVYIGIYDDPEDAARAYDQKALELFGEFANLNFPAEVHHG